MMPRFSGVAIAVLLVGLTACSGSYRNSIQGSYGSAFTRGTEAMRAKDYDRAAEQYGFALGSGHPRAEIAYSKLLARGLGVEKDPARAAALLDSAYTKTSSYKGRAAFELGQLLFTGGDGPSGTVEADPERARVLLLEAREDGQARAASKLGQIYEEGLGVQANSTRAIAYYREVAETDPSAAIRLAKLLAKTGASDYMVQEAAYTGIGLLETRGEEGNQRAWLQLSDLFSRGEIVDADPERAIDYLENVADDGDPAVHVRLAGLYGRIGDSARQKVMLMRAADAGDVRAQTDLARLLLKPDTPDTDGETGQDYARRAIDQGSTAAMVYLGQALLRGEVLPRDPQGGEGLLRGATDAGHPGAARALGAAILKGDLRGRTPNEGKNLLENSANEGSASAMSTLGFAYLSGRGLPENEELALFWIRRAADAGNQRARSYLAERNDV